MALVAYVAVGSSAVALFPVVSTTGNVGATTTNADKTTNVAATTNKHGCPGTIPQPPFHLIQPPNS